MIGADPPDLIRFALGSGLRVGELCAVRWMDLNLDGIPVVTEDDMRLVPIAAVTGNLVYIKGKGLVRHDGNRGRALRAYTCRPEKRIPHSTRSGVVSGRRRRGTLTARAGPLPMANHVVAVFTTWKSCR